VIPFRPARRRPIVIPPPLRGPGWIAVNACCDSPSPDRELVFPSNGRFVTQEMFTIDRIRLRDGRLYEGNGSQTSQWHGEGAPPTLRRRRQSGAGGRRPAGVAPVPFGSPIVRTTDQFAGNYVVVGTRRGVYAIYGHIRPGTVRVRVGQRVPTGRRLGELGNSGNSTAPHLHFFINDAPDPRASPPSRRGRRGNRMSCLVLRRIGRRQREPVGLVPACRGAE
jgi:hypothetical protein